MHQQLRHQLWIIMAAAVVFFTNLGGARLWDQDETLHATCAREMFQRGDWVVPTFNGELFPDKPPLMFWLMMTAYRWFGITELAARFWSAVLGIGTALLTYHLGRLLFRAQVGLWAGLIVATSIIFTVSARAATADSALVFVTTLAMLLFVIGGMSRGRGEAAGSAAGGSRFSAYLSASWASFALMYAAMGVAVLAKGPVGVLLPVATIGLYLLVINGPQVPDRRQPAAGRNRYAARLTNLLCLFRPRNVWHIACRMRPLTAIVVVAAVGLPWYILVGMRTDGAWLAEFFGEHNLQRALKPREGHSGPLFYYLPAILIGFFPWSVFLGPSLVGFVRRIRDRHAWRAGCVFVACWFGVFLGFWSILGTKLPHYVLPAYPALALLTAMFVDAWITDPTCVSRWWLRSATITVVVVGIGIVVAIPIVASIYLPGEELLGVVGVLLVVGGAICYFQVERGRPYPVMVTFAVTSVAFLTAIFGFAALRVDRHQNATVLLAEIRRASPGPPRVAFYRFARESFVFYAGNPVPRLHNPDALAKFLKGAKRPYVYTSDEYEKEIEQHFPGEFYVLTRRPKFLKPGEVVILARRSNHRTPHTASKGATGTRR